MTATNHEVERMENDTLSVIETPMGKHNFWISNERGPISYKWKILAHSIELVMLYGIQVLAGRNATHRESAARGIFVTKDLRLESHLCECGSVRGDDDGGCGCVKIARRRDARRSEDGRVVQRHEQGQMNHRTTDP